ncbi:hypothetical protein EB796_014778 [Bugula neritina]|nr:hypothetical protein EB796_014778 [Bugula neritina]
MYLIAVNLCEHAMCPRCPCSMYPYIYREANCNPLIHSLYMCNSKCLRYMLSHLWGLSVALVLIKTLILMVRAGNCHAKEDIYSAVNRVFNQVQSFLTSYRDDIGNTFKLLSPELCLVTCPCVGSAPGAWTVGGLSMEHCLSQPPAVQSESTCDVIFYCYMM